MSLLKKLDHWLAQKLYSLANRMNGQTAKMQIKIDRMNEEERWRPIESLGRSLIAARERDQRSSRGLLGKLRRLSLFV